MSISSVPSADKKTGKNGQMYPAKRITLGVSKINEASYKGNIGVMELAKFHSSASQEDKNKFVDLMKKKKEAKSDHEEKQMASQIWDHVQKVTGTKLHQMESKMIKFSQMLESKEDFILQTLADKDINASVKDGKVHIHDHTQHKKAQGIVKRLGMPHEVVKASIKEDTIEESSEHKIGSRVHIGMGQKGGAGVIGRLEKIDGEWAHVRSEHEETGLGGKKYKPVWKGLVRHMSSMNESTDTTVLEAMPTHHFNNMVRGYLAHKKAAKKGNFTPMSVDRFKATYAKLHGISEEVLEELSSSTLKSYSKKAMSDTAKGKELQRFLSLMRANIKLKKRQVTEDQDEIDSVELDIPLLTRVFEYAREDVKSDEDLHVLISAIVEASKEKDTLTMDDYKRIIDDKKASMTEEKKLIVPTLKPRDPNHFALMAKKVASGRHKDKKKEMRNGGSKHKGQFVEELNNENE